MYSDLVQGKSITLESLANWSAHHIIIFLLRPLEVSMQSVVVAPEIPVGKIKSFGPFGPKYEVRSPLRRLEDGDWLIEVALIESGEKSEYRLSHLIEDPEAP